MKHSVKNRIFVLGLDGIPHSLLEDFFNQKRMPYLASFAEVFKIKRMNSVYPTVSSVAWTSFSTGKNPAEHNIFGFVDRIPNPFSFKILTANDKKATSIWDTLSLKGKKCIVINVPVTYPPSEINGILISDFLCPDLSKCAYPGSINDFLKEREYVIDVEASLARESKSEFMRQLHLALDKRFEIAFELIRNYEWDYFQLHIMETDRLLHFFYSAINKDGDFSKELAYFFEKLDSHIYRLLNLIGDSCKVIILSDHGFCEANYEVQLNSWLEKQDLLKFDGPDRKFENYSKGSICYSLVPGRIFINLEDREEKGSVKKQDYEKVRRDIKQRLLNFTNPENNEKIIDKVYLREEIYSGPYFNNAADIIVHPNYGYDLKSRTESQDIFVPHPFINGMHTFDDAFVVGKDIDLSPVSSIQDIKKIILEQND